jgi:hypothetical protein
MTALRELERQVLAQREKLSELAAKEGTTDIAASVRHLLALERQIPQAPIRDAQDAAVKLRSVARMLDMLDDQMRGDADSRDILVEVLAWLEARARDRRPPDPSYRHHRAGEGRA